MIAHPVMGMMQSIPVVLVALAVAALKLVVAVAVRQGLIRT